MSQESERTEGFAPGVAPSLEGHGERPEPRGAQGRVEGEGAETSGRHQEPAREAAPAGEDAPRRLYSFTFVACLLFSNSRRRQPSFRREPII